MEAQKKRLGGQIGTVMVRKMVVTKTNREWTLISFSLFCELCYTHIVATELLLLGESWGVPWAILQRNRTGRMCI